MDIPQSRVLPPEVFDAIYNVSAAWLLGRVAELWPFDQQYVDVVEPFLRVDIQRAVDGKVSLPAEYRNFLGAAALLNHSKTGACQEDMPDELALRIHDLNAKKSSCLGQPIRIVDQTEWEFLTKDIFDAPTLENPIGCFFGEKKLKICPAGIGRVEIRYFVNEKLYKYGYTMQPDDTYIYNATTSVESEFPNAAFAKLYAVALRLLSVYFRDGNVAAFASALNDVEFK